MLYVNARVAFGVRRPVGALVAGDPSPAASRQVATDESGDRSPHSKVVARSRRADVCDML